MLYMYITVTKNSKLHMFKEVVLTALSLIHVFQWYLAFRSQFYWLRKPEYPEKTHRPATSQKPTDLPQVTDKLYHICCIKYTSPWAGFKLTTLVVIGTDCTNSCKSNYIFVPYEHDHPLAFGNHNNKIPVNII